MRQIAIFAGCAAVLFTCLPAAHAQRIAVQEPTLETFGVGTAVSVPDRGRMKIAGSGSAAASRSMFGPVRSGTNMGLSTQGSGVSVGVYVHDLEEMDHRILASAEKSCASGTRSSVSKSADRAYESLRAEAAARAFAKGAKNLNMTAAKTEDAAGSATQAAVGPSAERLMDRARQAEAIGKRELALAYLRTARDLGSKQAREEIDRLSSRTR